MAGWETKYTELKNINGGNKYTTDSQLTIDMFIVPIENAEYAVQKSLSAESIATGAKNKVDTLAKVASSGSYNDLINKPSLFDGNYNSLYNKPTSLPASDVYSWAKKSTKPSYTASEIGTYTTSEIDTKLGTKQNTIDSNNKLSYSLLKDTPTNLSSFTNDSGYATTSQIPTKLSQLKNDNRNMYMNSASWVNSPQLPSTGLYILKVRNSNINGIGGGYINLGLVNYDGNSAYWSVYFGGQNYRVYITTSGGVNFQLWTGNSVANLSGTTYYYYIKLS